MLDHILEDRSLRIDKKLKSGLIMSVDCFNSKRAANLDLLLSSAIILVYSAKEVLQGRVGLKLANIVNDINCSNHLNKMAG